MSASAEQGAGSFEAAFQALKQAGVVLTVRMPIPLSRMGRYLRGWSKAAYTEQWGEYMVVIDPDRRGQ
jgi:hypothetical protein